MILAECDRLYMCRARVKFELRSPHLYVISHVYTQFIYLISLVHAYEGTFFFCIYILYQVYTKCFFYIFYILCIIQMYFILRIFSQSQKEYYEESNVIMAGTAFSFREKKMFHFFNFIFCLFGSFFSNVFFCLSRLFNVFTEQIF